MSPLAFGSARLECSPENLVPDSQDISVWDVSGSPTKTGGELDPWGGLTAWLIGDEVGGTSHYFEEQVVFQSGGQKSISVLVKKGDSVPTSGSRVTLRDTTAAADRAVFTIGNWSGAAPPVTWSTGTKVFERPWAAGWYRLCILSTSVTGGNTHEIRVTPALSAGDIRFGGAAVVESTIPGGHARTRGTAISYWADALSGERPWFHYNLEVPLQSILPAAGLWRTARESATRRVREVTTVALAVDEFTAQVRYASDKARLNHLLQFAAQGYPLVYVPDTADLDTAFEVELLEPGEDWAQQPEQDFGVFQEGTLSIRCRRMDGGSLAGLYS